MLAHKISSEKFSYADYLLWPDHERWEIINGVAYDMSPGPTMKHQDISFKLSGIFYNFLKNSRCRAFAAPFDVLFPEKENSENVAFEHKSSEHNNLQDQRFKHQNLKDTEIQTVVQPDLVVVCDQNKLQQRGCFGAPDIVVEILSKSTAYKDETQKLRLYEKNGVKEYWIVNPDAEYIMIYRLDEKDKYAKPEYLIKGDTLVSHAVKGLSVDLLELWA